MKVAYFDCMSGISGDMFLAALIDAGASEQEIFRNLQKLKLGRQFKIYTKKVKINSIAGRRLIISAAARPDKPISLNDIKKIIKHSRLSDFVKTKSLEIFNLLAQAEGRIHQQDLSKVHFHELGALDSIIDIVGSCIAVELIGLERIFVGGITLGRGTINCAHGMLPAPAPAALELLKNKTVNLSSIPHELVTPTGAAVLKALAQQTHFIPQLKIKSIGYGKGSFELPGFFNMLRVIIGETSALLDHDEVIVVETNIDDTRPINFEYIYERLFSAGAVDVYITNIIMKKNRPAVKLSVLVKEENLLGVIDEIFKQTSTMGVRTYRTYRYKLKKKIMLVRTKYGRIRVKIGLGPGNKVVLPEYEDCKKMADKLNIPFQDIYEEVKRAYSHGLTTG
ncbi:MAG: nickel pincer cofactor biosynthesis protein LarC [Candidatus Omnitrophota bacterium]